MNEPLKIKPIPIEIKNKNNSVLPHPLRCLIVGPSGCGKTTLLYNLMQEKWGVVYDKLLVFSKTLEQPFYKELQKAFEVLGGEIASFYDDMDEMITVDVCENNAFVVFDDCVNAKNQNVIKDYFYRGRQKNVSVAYLTQSYTKIDSQLIRTNLNCLFVFKQNKHHTKTIYNDCVGSDFTLKEFTKLCEDCWNEKYGALIIFPMKKKCEGRYRKSVGWSQE